MTRRPASAVTLLALLGLLAGCTRQAAVRLATPAAGEPPAATALPLASPTAETTALPTVPPTQAPVLTEPSAGLPQPSPTLAPTLPPPEAQRISFAPGATSATVEGRLEAGGTAVYVLRAAAGQVLELMVLTPSSSARLEVWGADGQVLKHAAVGGPAWRGTLPLTQDYYAAVQSGDAPADYALLVTLPVRISLAPGTLSRTVTGRVEVHEVDAYALAAGAGQVMEVYLETASRDVGLEVWGVDGQVLQPATGAVRAWRGTVPSSQEYLIAVPSLGSAADYALTVTLLPAGEPGEPARIEFPAGGTQATLSASLAAYGADLYVLRAAAGQTLAVTVEATSDTLQVEVWGADGVVLKRYADGPRAWSGVLPADQDYFVQVVSFGDEATYTLSVSIPPP